MHHIYPSISYGLTDFKNKNFGGAMKEKYVYLFLIMIMLVVPASTVAAKTDQNNIGINVLLTTITDEILADLGNYGKVNDVLYSIDAVTMRIKESELETIKGLPYVLAADPDAVRTGSPIDTVAVEDFSAGLSTWNLDVINVTDFGYDNRQVEFDGNGVYVAVLDTGLVDLWRQYFPEERIAEEYAKSFGGGGGDLGTVIENPNKWEHDTNSHGTHVTSTILGYSFYGTPVNGVAPLATVIPVKVLNQNGSGWSSVVARGIEYIGDLKAGPLAEFPVVINMSLGGPVLDAVEQAAIDYAIEQGVIIVASAGNNGTYGMGYPGAYEPVISVAASGWAGEWLAGNWWYGIDDPDPNMPEYYYIVDFSSRELSGQDLDVAAPGSWVVGPYNPNLGQISYYYLGGTSMASPHVAGTVALMAEKYQDLTAGVAEEILEGSALYLATGCLDVYTPYGYTEEICWGADATGAGLVDATAAINATP
jgi:subtilisin family serine protease